MPRLTAYRKQVQDAPVQNQAVSTLVVARYRDGRLVKGISMDVDPTKPMCHVRAPDGVVTEIKLVDLKALFFVKTLEGNSAHNEGLAVDQGDRRSHGSTAIAIKFEDNEHLVGFTNRYPPNRPFFFVVPADTKSNNIRILVNKAAVVSMDVAALPQE